jgi:uncharacterized protein YfdQ (DUF2303 family)
MKESDIEALAKEIKKPVAISQQFFRSPFKTPRQDASRPDVPEFLEVPLLAIPDGYRMQDVKSLIDAFRDVPERRKGSVKLSTAQSFIDFANRNKGEDTVLFASNGLVTGTISAIFDYDPAGDDQTKAGWQEFDASYDFPTSEAFKIWAGKSGKPQTMKDFAFFMNDRIPDLGMASEENQVKFDLGILAPVYAEPAAILELADGITLNAKKKYSQHQRLSSGEHQIEFAEEHGDTTTRTGKTIKVPEFFLLNISVFEEGPKMLIPVRLRYGVDDSNGVSWTFTVWNVVQIFNQAFREEVAAITDATEIPLFFGVS